MLRIWQMTLSIQHVRIHFDFAFFEDILVLVKCRLSQVWIATNAMIWALIASNVQKPSFKITVKLYWPAFIISIWHQISSTWNLDCSISSWNHPVNMNPFTLSALASLCMQGWNGKPSRVDKHQLLDIVISLDGQTPLTKNQSNNGRICDDTV